MCWAFLFSAFAFAFFFYYTRRLRCIHHFSNGGIGDGFGVPSEEKGLLFYVFDFAFEQVLYLGIYFVYHWVYFNSSFVDKYYLFFFSSNINILLAFFKF